MLSIYDNLLLALGSSYIIRLSYHIPSSEGELPPRGRGGRAELPAAVLSTIRRRPARAAVGGLPRGGGHVHERGLPLLPHPRGPGLQHSEALPHRRIAQPGTIVIFIAVLALAWPGQLARKEHIE